jgi:hypothetical protein
VNRSPNSNAGIFVQIPAYRDPECQWTIKDMYEKAKNPERIFTSICWQFIKKKDNICFQQPSPRPEQVRVTGIDARESKGVCWVRAKALRKYTASDRTGLERLFRYCARPIFASERLQWIEKDQRLIYRLKPKPDGQTLLTLTPLEFIDKLALLIPPPRKHRHRYHGVLVPNAPLRQAVTAYAGLSLSDQPVLPVQEPVNTEDLTGGESKAPSSSVYLWAILIARIYEIGK